MKAASRLSTSEAGLALDLLTGPALTPDRPRRRRALLQRASWAGPTSRPPGLLAVADVAGTRYADFGLAQRLANLDPVVTAGGDRLRFESFSMCNGVHARFDLLRDGLGSSEVGFGTTNVDINQPLRTALARVGRNDVLHLAVGADELQVSSVEETLTEEKVPLPDRWVRGLAETSHLLAGMEPVASQSGAEARRFFGSLPRVAPPGPGPARAADARRLAYDDQAGGRLRAPARCQPSPGLRPDPALRGPPHGAPPPPRQHRMGLRPRRSTAHARAEPGPVPVLQRGGRAARPAGAPGRRGSRAPHPRPPRVVAGDRPGPARARDRPVAVVVRAGLAWLSASGRLGFDLDEGAWFHRELPVDSDAVMRRHPRLNGARRLLDTDGVAAGDEPGTWRVRGTKGDVHTVSDGAACTCRWGVEHDGARGPCKHVLAVLLLLRILTAVASPLGCCRSTLAGGTLCGVEISSRTRTPPAPCRSRGSSCSSACSRSAGCSPIRSSRAIDPWDDSVEQLVRRPPTPDGDVLAAWGSHVADTIVGVILAAVAALVLWRIASTPGARSSISRCSSAAPSCSTWSSPH